MLLTIDIGNSNIVFGGFRGSDLDQFFRVKTRKNLADPEWECFLHKQFIDNNIQPTNVLKAVISSVVPDKNNALINTLKTSLHINDPYIVTHNSHFHIKCPIENKETLGIDRMVNVAAAHEKYHTDLIIVDVGTATTFDVIKDNVFIGGVIVPGPQTLKKSLLQNTAQLTELNIHLEKPSKIVGHNTKESIQSGLYHGYIGLIENILAKITAEQKTDFVVVFTGGAAPLFLQELSHSYLHEPHLTLDGLRLVYEWNT
jgi:type III pantothenate kinase